LAYIGRSRKSPAFEADGRKRPGDGARYQRSRRLVADLPTGEAAGELMAAMKRDGPVERGKKRHAEPAAAAASEYRETIDRARIPERTAQRWQELAEVPKERFEAHLAAEEKPSARTIIESTKAKPQMSDGALCVALAAAGPVMLAPKGRERPWKACSPRSAPA
jgi:hypothetical protein